MKQGTGESNDDAEMVEDESNPLSEEEKRQRDLDNSGDTLLISDEEMRQRDPDVRKLGYSTQIPEWITGEAREVFIATWKETNFSSEQIKVIERFSLLKNPGYKRYYMYLLDLWAKPDPIERDENIRSAIESVVKRIDENTKRILLLEKTLEKAGVSFSEVHRVLDLGISSWGYAYIFDYLFTNNELTLGIELRPNLRISIEKELEYFDLDRDRFTAGFGSYNRLNAIDEYQTLRRKGVKFDLITSLNSDIIEGGTFDASKPDSNHWYKSQMRVFEYIFDALSENGVFLITPPGLIDKYCAFDEVLEEAGWIKVEDPIKEGRLGYMARKENIKKLLVTLRKLSIIEEKEGHKAAWESIAGNTGTSSLPDKKAPRGSPAEFFRVIYTEFEPGKISLKALRERLNLAESTADRDTNRLVSAGLIKKDGKGDQAQLERTVTNPDDELTSLVYDVLAELGDKPRVGEMIEAFKEFFDQSDFATLEDEETKNVPMDEACSEIQTLIDEKKKEITDRLVVVAIDGDSCVGKTFLASELDPDKTLVLHLDGIKEEARKGPHKDILSKEALLVDTMQRKLLSLPKGHSYEVLVIEGFDLLKTIDEWKKISNNSEVDIYVHVEAEIYTREMILRTKRQQGRLPAPGFLDLIEGKDTAMLDTNFLKTFTQNGYPFDVRYDLVVRNDYIVEDGAVEFFDEHMSESDEFANILREIFEFGPEGEPSTASVHRRILLKEAHVWILSVIRSYLEDKYPSEDFSSLKVIVPLTGSSLSGFPRAKESDLDVYFLIDDSNLPNGTKFEDIDRTNIATKTREVINRIIDEDSSLHVRKLQPLNIQGEKVWFLSDVLRFPEDMDVISPIADAFLVCYGSVEEVRRKILSAIIYSENRYGKWKLIRKKWQEYVNKKHIDRLGERFVPREGLDLKLPDLTYMLDIYGIPVAEGITKPTPPLKLSPKSLTGQATHDARHSTNDETGTAMKQGTGESDPGDATGVPEHQGTDQKNSEEPKEFEEPTREEIIRILTALASFAHGTNASTNTMTYSTAVNTGFAFIVKNILADEDLTEHHQKAQEMQDNIDEVSGILMDLSGRCAGPMDLIRKNAWEEVDTSKIISWRNKARRAYNLLKRAKESYDEMADSISHHLSVFGDLNIDEYFEKLVAAFSDRMSLVDGEVSQEVFALNDIFKHLYGELSVKEADDYSKYIEISFPDENIWIRGNKLSINSMICNLVMNSYRAAKEHKGEEARVIVEVTLAKGEVVITIRDNGPGIQEAGLENIWKPFYSTTGGGIGLTEARLIAELHGGKITVTSIAHEDYAMASGGNIQFQEDLMEALEGDVYLRAKSKGAYIRMVDASRELNKLDSMISSDELSLIEARRLYSDYLAAYDALNSDLEKDEGLKPLMRFIQDGFGNSPVTTLGFVIEIAEKEKVIDEAAREMIRDIFEREKGKMEIFRRITEGSWGDPGTTFTAAVPAILIESPEDPEPTTHNPRPFTNFEEIYNGPRPAQSFFNQIIYRARKAAKKGENIFIGLDTSYMRSEELAYIQEFLAKLSRLKIKNIKFVRSNGRGGDQPGRLAYELTRRIEKSEKKEGLTTPLSNIIIIGDTEILEHKAFKRFITQGKPEQSAFFGNLYIPKDIPQGMFMKIDLPGWITESLGLAFGKTGVRAKRFNVELAPIESEILEKLSTMYALYVDYIARGA
ncbi:MAG: hypothetical protein HQ594_05480 [Candidatus Omnitrophica bacterium]|nr:hypothetical protein [Candidatus Omnitrophota bacterium]